MIRWDRIRFVTLLILEDTVTREMQQETRDGALLLVEMFHCGGTKKNKDTDPEGSLLKRDRFIGLFSFFCIIGLEEHRVEEKREKAENKKQLDKEDSQIFRMVLDPAAGLSGNELVDIVEINPAGKQQDDQQNPRDLFVMLIEGIGDRLDLLLGNRLFEPRSHSYDEKRESANPDNRRC